MKTLKMIGYRRAELGKQDARQLRKKAYTPCVLYGGSEQVHFYLSMALLQELIYTPDVHFVDLTIADTVYPCILQDAQFHPVSDMTLHVDFLQIFDHKKVKMKIPTMITGQAPGVMKGGSLVTKLRKLPIFAYPKYMPATIQVDVSGLELGKMVRVKDLGASNYTILVAPNTPIVSVEIPRALRSATGKAEATSGEA